MSYTVKNSQGTTIATIADGTVNSTSTSLTLIGKNYAGYGIFLNENYVQLLENFSATTPPSAPVTGQLYWDSGKNLLNVYTGTAWKTVSSSTSQNTSPSGATIGDLWWDTSNQQLNVYNASKWVVIGPSYTTTSGTSGAVVESMLDNGSASHVIVKFYISNTVVAILSKDPTFTPASGVAGFTTIVPGFNLTTAISGALYTGTVSTAATLQGITASQFLRSDTAASTSYTLGVGQLNVGSDLTVTASADVGLTNGTLNKDLNFSVNKAGASLKVVSINGTAGSVIFNAPGGLLPSATTTYNIGSPTYKFGNVYAANYIGTAITAAYADLAERFEADAPMLPGTVVEIGGLKEITAAVQELSESVFGVISTAAGFLMNGLAGTNATHPPVAVNGRVPVRVIGVVKKGDRLVSAGNGLARAASRSELTAFNVIGRSLEDKTTTSEGTVEAIVKLNS